MSSICGATPADWAHFDVVLGLTEDLLPVVSNQQRKISPQSKMQSIGKTPSLLRNGMVSGIAEWASKKTNPTEIAAWARQPDYGICVQTRYVRPLDLDLDDPGFCQEVRNTITEHLGHLPVRHRQNSSKCLLAFTLPGSYGKRVIKTRHGIIEFLANGQQFVAVGTHPSGVRYVWNDNTLPADFPEITSGQFETLWTDLQRQYGIEDPTESKPTERAAILANAIHSDPIAKRLQDEGLVLSTDRTGKMHITCPWRDEHTDGVDAESSTTYFPANTGGYSSGHFKCLHAHCQARTVADLKEVLAITDIDDFDILPELTPIAEVVSPKKEKFLPIHVSEFASGEVSIKWHIKHILPVGALGVLYGPSTAGKSFVAIDWAMAIVRGADWRDNHVTQGKVVYVVCEGIAGFNRRLRAYARHHNLCLKDIELYVIPATPNLLKGDDVRDLIHHLLTVKPALVVIDTLAQAMVGGDESSSADMGQAISHCQTVHTVVGCTVLLVHHTGKDAGKGARGHSSLKAATDVEFEVEQDDDSRVVRCTKQKDGEVGQDMGFGLIVVPLGLDDEGEEITSCVIEHTNASIKGKAKPHKPREIEQYVLAAFNEMCLTPDVGVECSALAEFALCKLIEVRGEPKNSKEKGNQKANISRAINCLFRNKILSQYQGLVRMSSDI